jgi:uncharacterized protein (UPF0335 family)
MAKTVKEEAQKKTVAKQDLNRVIKEAVRLKQTASEYVGQHGAYVKNQIENYGLDRTALSMTMRLKNLETARQQTVMRCLLDYAHKAGLFDQTDLFDDTVRTLEIILETIKGAPRQPSPTDPTINALVN